MSTTLTQHHFLRTTLTTIQQLGDATAVTNPAGPTYTATLPNNPLGVEGSIVATQGKDGKGVHFDVEFKNIPKEGGPFRKYTKSIP